MKRIVLTLVFLAAMSVQAHALLPIGLTFGVRGGTSVSSISDKNLSEDLKLKSDSKLFLGANANLKIFSLRGELEYLYRDSFSRVKESISGDSEKLNAHSVMANLYYDYFSFLFLSLYVNGGVGQTFFSGFDDPSNFTWNAGTGLTVSLLGIANVDLGYRYFDMGDVKIGNKNSKQTSHDIYLGVRFGF